MSEITQSTQELVEKYAAWQASLKSKGGASTIHVDEVASRVAAFYEHIRTIIDWKEEHLMRRAAIIRKLKRRFLDLELNNFNNTENIAEPLVLEFIRGGFFLNDTIEESKIADVQRIIEKYVFILKNCPENKKGKAGLTFYNQLLEIAACEIEETLAPSLKEMALIEFMFVHMQERIKVSDGLYKSGKLKEEDTDVQIYIAVQQALFKFDSPIISYNIIKYKYPEWNNPLQSELMEIAQNMFKILQTIEQDLAHPLARKFYTICEKYDTPYLLLGDILAKNEPQKALDQIQDPAALENAVRSAYSKRLANLKVKIRRAAIYSTASIFITKILSLFILEIILAKLFSGHLDIVSLIADILIPTTLMAVLILTIRPPTTKNMTLAIMETMKIVYKQDKVDTYDIKSPRKRTLGTRLFLSFIYLLGAAVSFGAIFWVFNFFHFPITSIVINIVFIALILFAGTAVRSRSEELTIETESGGLIMFISDVLLLPIASVGKWMSNKWKKYNAITTFFNALIDMPFSVFIEFLERWRYFIKDKKEELR